MNNKSQLIKGIVTKIDIGKIISYPQYPESRTLRRIVKNSKKVQESNNDQGIFKLAVDLAYYLDFICDPSKIGFVKDEKEKNYWLEISRGLFENTAGVKK